MAQENDGYERFNKLSVTIQSKGMRNKAVASIKVNGKELGDIASNWKIEQKAGYLPNLVITIPLHDIPQIVL